MQLSYVWGQFSNWFISNLWLLERVKEQPRRVLDEASRRRRQRKALEALEADNFQEDPHADLKTNKRAPKFDLDDGDELITCFVFY